MEGRTPRPWKDRATAGIQSTASTKQRLAGFDYASSDHAYFVTVCTEQRRAFLMDERLAGKVVDCLDWLRENRNMAIYAYCLMPDHLHLLIQPASAPDDVARPSMAGRDVYTLSDVIGSMKQFTTRQAWELGHRGVLRQERFYEHVVRKSEDGVRIAQYILDNPVRKGLVTAAEDYRWSGMPDPLT